MLGISGQTSAPRDMSKQVCCMCYGGIWQEKVYAPDTFSYLKSSYRQKKPNTNPHTLVWQWFAPFVFF